MTEHVRYSGSNGLTDATTGQPFIGLTIRNTIRQNTVSITTAATAIPATPLSKRKVLIIVNISANIIYLGDSSVTTSDGFQLRQQQSIQINIDDSVVIYGIAGSASEIRILEGD